MSTTTTPGRTKLLPMDLTGPEAAREADRLVIEAEDLSRRIGVECPQVAASLARLASELLRQSALALRDLNT